MSHSSVVIVPSFRRLSPFVFGKFHPPNRSKRNIFKYLNEIGVEFFHTFLRNKSGIDIME